MADWDDVRRIAMALPGAVQNPSRDGLAFWRVGGKGFVWERPLRASDLAALGDKAPQGPILGVRTADLGAKEALLAEDRSIYFTTPHFDGYPAVLVLLDHIDARTLEEVITDAWLARAPKTVAKKYLETLDAGLDT